MVNRRLLLFFMLLATAAWGQQENGPAPITGSGAPQGSLSQRLGTLFIDQSTSTTYICSSVNTPPGPAVSTCNWTQVNNTANVTDNAIHGSPKCSSTDANCYTVTPGGRVADASFNTTTTISFPNNDCPTFAKVGWIIFGTDYPTTFAGNGSVVVPQGTITAVCTAATGTLTVSQAATGNCTPTFGFNGNACEIDFGPDDTTPLTTFWNAVLASPCTPGILSAGIYLVQKGEFNGSATNLGLCQEYQGTAYISPSLTGAGSTFGGTVIVPTPNMDTTVGSGNSCGGGPSHRGCFFSTGSLQLSNISLWGAGQPRLTDTNVFSVAEFNSGPLGGSSYIHDVSMTGWAAQAPNSWGLETTFASVIWLLNVNVNAAGGIACVNTTTATRDDGFVMMEGGACANGLAVSNGGQIGCFWNSGTGDWFSNHVIYGTVTSPSAGNTFVICGNVTAGRVFSNNDIMEIIPTGSVPGFAWAIGGLATTANLQLNHEVIDDDNATSATTIFTVKNHGALVLTDSLFNVLVSGSSNFDTQTGSVVFDQGYNAYIGFGNDVYANGTICMSTFLVVPVAALCASTAEGSSAQVNNANSTTFNAAAVGGGTNHVSVRYNGSGWVIY